MEALPDELQTCAAAAAELSGQVAGITLAGPVDGIAGCLPGGTAAGVGTALGDTWATRIVDLARDVDEHAQRLRTSAENYRGTDDYNAAAFPRPAQ